MGDQVEMFVKCIVGLFWRTNFQHDGKTVPQRTLTTISTRCPAQPQSGELQCRIRFFTSPKGLMFDTTLMHLETTRWFFSSQDNVACSLDKVGPQVTWETKFLPKNNLHVNHYYNDTCLCKKIIVKRRVKPFLCLVIVLWKLSVNLTT